MTTSGISVIAASPRNSVLSAMPGPELTVNATFPAYDAPMATPAAEISSSAWCTMPPALSNTSLK